MSVSQPSSVRPTSSLGTRMLMTAEAPGKSEPSALEAWSTLSADVRLRDDANFASTADIGREVDLSSPLQEYLLFGNASDHAIA